jgi:Cation/multidrug efflux pump
VSEPRYFFIRRPVLAAVISIVITLLGVFAITLLPVSRYPQITPPAIQVTAVYPGATAEDVAERSRRRSSSSCRGFRVSSTSRRPIRATA